MGSVAASSSRMGPPELPPLGSLALAPTSTSPSPPQPPPMPSPVSRSKSVSPAQANHQAAYEPSGKQPLIARPTTAGLLRFPALPDEDCLHQEQVISRYTNNTLLPQFKQELLAKQTKLNTSSNATSIEDKIRQNKMNNHYNRPNFRANQNDERHQFQHHQVPEELKSAMQKETKPFAYTVDVSDPNNRGKLDLSQIKSPIMRRRLLANMQSNEEIDNEDDNDYYDDQDVIMQSETRSPVQFVSLPVQQEARAVRADNKPRISFSPVVSFSYADERQVPINCCSDQKPAQTEERLRRPIIRYHDAPRFYDNCHNSGTLARFGPYSSGAGSLKVEANQRTMDSLDAEMAETLDSFERILSDMSSNHSSPFSRVAPFQSKNQSHNNQQHKPSQNRTYYPANQQQVQWNQTEMMPKSSSVGSNCLSCLQDSKDDRTSRAWLRTFQA